MCHANGLNQHREDFKGDILDSTRFFVDWEKVRPEEAMACVLPSAGLEGPRPEQTKGSQDWCADSLFQLQEGESAHRHILDADTRKRFGKHLFGLRNCRHHNCGDQGRGRGEWLVVISSRGLQDAFGTDIVPLAGKFVAASGAANSLENALSDQRLQDWFKVSGWQTVPFSEGLCGNRAVVGMHGNIDHSGNREDAFSRKKRHLSVLTTRHGDRGSKDQISS
jgi:hypothetical protein